MEKEIKFDTLMDNARNIRNANYGRFPSNVIFVNGEDNFGNYSITVNNQMYVGFDDTEELVPYVEDVLKIEVLF